MTELELIDLSPALSGGDVGKRDVAAKMDEASRNIGFFGIKNHGVDLSVIENVFKSMGDFFNLPSERKKESIVTGRPFGQTRDGYVGLLEDNAHAFMGEKGPNDYVEKLRIRSSILGDKDGIRFPAPPLGPRLKADLQAYYGACLDLSKTLAELFALAVDLPGDFFVDKLDQSEDSMVLNYYPGFAADFANRQGVASHTDGSLLTILSTTGPGLEVRTRNGKWIDVKTAEADHFIINIGDPMMRWSNDVWLSNAHRVTLTDQPRKSIAFFKLINRDVVIAPFPKFCEKIGAKYLPLRFSEWIDKKSEAFMTAQADLAIQSESS